MARERRYFVIESEFDPAPGRYAAGPHDWFEIRAGGAPRTKSLGSGRAAFPRDSGRLTTRVETMTEAQAADVGRDGRVRVVGEPMPMALIDGRPSSTEGSTPENGGGSWGIDACGASATGTDGTGVKPAVIDSGIDLAHPAFASVTDRIEVRDFTGSASEGHDVMGHGTHCAGTMFGQDVDGRRIGIAREFERAFVAKVFGDDGASDTASLWDAMIWAQRSGANVISMSLGFDVPGMIERLMDWYDLPQKVAASQALVSFAKNLRAFDTQIAAMEAQAAFGGGALVFAASGNESERDVDPRHVVSASLPASAKGVIPVGAFGPLDRGYCVADFSNTDPACVAPGVGILSAEAGGTGLLALDGTSMACPHAAGVAALWWQRLQQKDGDADPARVRDALFGAMTQDGLVERRNGADYGRGRIMAPVDGEAAARAR